MSLPAHRLTPQHLAELLTTTVTMNRYRGLWSYINQIQASHWLLLFHSLTSSLTDSQNYTTSEDNENAPSISSDLPENMAEAEAECVLDRVHVEYGGLEDPSSQEDSLKNTECTQLDQDTLEDDEEEEDLDETNAEEIKTEERDLPPDFKPELTNSITSEADVTNKDSDGSLHDSMEILEEVNTEDRFEHDLKGGSFETSEGNSVQHIQWKVTLPPKSAGIKPNLPGAGVSKPGLLKKPSVSLSESSGKYVVTEGTEEIIL